MNMDTGAPRPLREELLRPGALAELDLNFAEVTSGYTGPGAISSAAIAAATDFE